MRKPAKSEAPFIQALRNYFDRRRYTTLTQVQILSETGSRHADALVLGRLNAFDLSIQGFEIKNSRSDWQLELKNPMKAETGASHCDGWSLLTHPGVADPEEIPPSWGHWVLEGKNLKILKEAPALHPKPVDRSFVANLLGTVLDQAGQNIELLSSQADYDRGFVEGREEGYNRADKSQDYLISRLAKKERELEAALGRLRTAGLLHKSTEEIEALNKIVNFSHHFGYKGLFSLLDAVQSFAKVDVASLKSSLLGLHSRAAEITKLIGDNMGITETVEALRSQISPQDLLKIANEVQPQETESEEDGE